MIRRVLVFVLFDPELPIQKNSKLDVSLLRAAQQALMRQQNGIIDCFLFVICGNSSEQDIAKFFMSYNFPDVQVITVHTKDEDQNEIDYDDLKDILEMDLSAWLKKHHPAAITDLSGGRYDSLDIWWSGVEAIDNVWCFTEAYAETLPDTHKNKAGTWLSILKDALELDDPEDWLDENHFALYAATLCEFLHGFEAAIRNDFNLFDVETLSNALEIDNFYLGYIFCQLEGADLRNVFDECDDDLSMLNTYALKRATEEERSNIRAGLSNFFGSDVALFWALYTAIRPKLSECSAEACNDLMQSSDWDTLAEISNAWELITCGWTDSADE